MFSPPPSLSYSFILFMVSMFVNVPAFWLKTRWCCNKKCLLRYTLHSVNSSTFGSFILNVYFELQDVFHIEFVYFLDTF